MGYADVLRSQLSPSPAQTQQARCGLPYLRRWCARAGLVYAAGPICNVVHGVSRPTIRRFVESPLTLTQPHQAGLIVQGFARRLADPALMPAVVVAQFSAILPGLADVLVGAARAGGDPLSDLCEETGLGRSAVADTARLCAVPPSVAAHVAAAVTVRFAVALTPAAAAGDRPVAGQAARGQIYDWFERAAPAVL
ncbi:MAG: hypothetical protein KF887_09940 [Paracoccaceae bacterium]|nr:MAG: hypothetical protein KF887_09940 [Paracoccaceae bacterium]